MRLWWKTEGLGSEHSIGVEVAEIIGFRFNNDSLDVEVTMLGDATTVYAVPLDELYIDEPGKMLPPRLVKLPVLTT